MKGRDNYPASYPSPFWSTYTCCREWECHALAPIGRCGLCGEVPR